MWLRSLLHLKSLKQFLIAVDCSDAKLTVLLDRNSKHSSCKQPADVPVILEVV